MIKQEVKDQCMLLLRMAQNGNKFAEHDLLELIRTNVMPRRIGKYINRNRQVDNDDVKQEFMIGVAKVIKDARFDMGDPLEYLVYQGICRVKSYMRKHIIQGTMQVCKDCGNKTRLRRTKTGYQCSKCGSTNVETCEIDDHNEILLENMMDYGFEDDVISQLSMDEFKSTLTPGTNVYNLYILLEDGVDRDNPMVKNYIKEIAKMWGGCSEENVMQNLNKLRNRLSKWMDEMNTVLT